MGLDIGIYGNGVEFNWRKRNAMRRFIQERAPGFVDNGNCEISGDLLLDLLAVCKVVKLDNSLAPSVLPYQEGFFFGSYEYDEWYFQALDETISDLESINISDDDIFTYSEWY